MTYRLILQRTSFAADSDELETDAEHVQQSLSQPEAWIQYGFVKPYRLLGLLSGFTTLK